MRISFLDLLPVLLPTVTAWGMLGHRTTALLASRYLTPHTASTVRSLLAPDSLLSASTWADYYAHTPEGRFSAPWHWIDADDAPPLHCNLSLSRDCSSHGCIISAITNHTARAIDTSLLVEDRRESLKWVIHFVGDVHQPLHTEGMLRGGNGIEVVWGGRNTSLHHVWDSAIAEKCAGGRGVRDAVRWGDELYERIEDGEWKVRDWKCEGEECPLKWATESNGLMCGTVLGEGYVEGSMGGVELQGEYFEGVRGVVEERVAMAGWRLAGWLEGMFGDGTKEVEGILEEL